MKKQLKQELIALAKEIIKAQEQGEISTLELKHKALNLYEKLTLLHYTEKTIAAPNSFSESKPGTSPKHANEAAEEKEETEVLSKTQETEEEYDNYAPDGTQYHDGEAITEPNTEKIKDIVAQMPAESQDIEKVLERVLPQKHQKNDMEDIGGIHYDKLPQFEPVSYPHPDNEKVVKPEQGRPKSLNDRLKSGIQIGLNERLAFVKHLFDGSSTDYNRVLSQLNTFKTKDEATDFVLNMVKRDYNNWEGKEEYEIRFLALIENKFE